MNLSPTDRRSLPQYRSPTICEACGTAFTCGATLGNCWCAEIELSEATHLELRARYTNCLCRECLERFANGERNNGEKEEQVFTGTTD